MDMIVLTIACTVCLALDNLYSHIREEQTLMILKNTRLPDIPTIVIICFPPTLECASNIFMWLTRISNCVWVYKEFTRRVFYWWLFALGLYLDKDPSTVPLGSKNVAGWPKHESGSSFLVQFGGVLLGKPFSIRPGWKWWRWWWSC